MKFKPGESGNPRGRPKGVQDRRVELRALLEPYAAALVQKAVKMALAGDCAAMRIVLDRIVPPLKARDAAIQLSGFHGTLGERGSAVLGALAAGHITADEAATVMQALSAQARVVHVDELERRLSALESKSQE